MAPSQLHCPYGSRAHFKGSRGRGWTFALLAGLAILAGCGGGGGEAGGVETAVVQPDSGTGSARVSWTPVPDSDLAGYRVYFGTTSRSYLQPRGQGLNAGLAVTFVVRDLTMGQRYFFAVTAFDSSGNESDYSEEASKLIQ